MYSSMDSTSPIHKARSLDVMSKDADSSQTLSCQRNRGLGGGGGGGARGENIREEDGEYLDGGWNVFFGMYFIL